MADNPRIDDLRRKLDKDAGSRLFAQLAEELRKEGDLAEAIRVARSGLAHHPSYPSARMTLGRALFDSGELPGARAEFEAVLRGAPDNILASRFLAECLEAMGDLGSALLQYRAALRMAAGDKQIEAQIRALEQKLTPVRKPSGAGGGEPAAPGAPIPVSAAVDESFELEAPFGAGGLHAPEEARPRRPLEIQAPFEEEEAEGAPTLPKMEAPVFDEPPSPPRGETGGTRPVPVVPRAALAEPGEPPGEPDLPAASPPPGSAPPASQPPGPPGPAPEPTAWYLETSPGLRGEASAPASPPAAAGEASLSSSTLAELYFRQGFVDKAIEVYRQLLQREPGNERARERVEELGALGAGSSAAPEGAADERSTRRRRIAGTIARLEELLATIQRNAAAGGPR